MLKITQKIINQKLHNSVFTEHDLALVVGGSKPHIYSLLNTAIKKGEIIRIRRGLYILNESFRKGPVNDFYLASKIVTPSYVSLEAALSFHGWIPERVMTISSIIYKGKARAFETTFGIYEYIKIPINQYEFLSGVKRFNLENQSFFMASPLRAIADLVYINKLKWSGIKFLVEGYRIEFDDLATLTLDDFRTVKRVYRSVRVLNFLKKMQKALL